MDFASVIVSAALGFIHFALGVQSWRSFQLAGIHFAIAALSFFVARLFLGQL